MSAKVQTSHTFTYQFHLGGGFGDVPRQPGEPGTVAVEMFVQFLTRPFSLFFETRRISARPEAKARGGKI